MTLGRERLRYKLKRGLVYDPVPDKCNVPKPLVYALKHQDRSKRGALITKLAAKKGVARSSVYRWLKKNSLGWSDAIRGRLELEAHSSKSVVH